MLSYFSYTGSDTVMTSGGVGRVVLLIAVGRSVVRGRRVPIPAS
ncbi:hypothetical protein [Candidatus Flexifilum breve]